MGVHMDEGRILGDGHVFFMYRLGTQERTNISSYYGIELVKPMFCGAVGKGDSSNALSYTRQAERQKWLALF